MKPILRFSRGGLVASALFLAVAVAALAWLFLVASKNPADSGESGILLLPLVMPWIMMLPDDSVGPGTALGCLALNAGLLYAVFGGVRLRR